MAVTNFIAEVWASQILEAFQETAVLAPTCADYSGETRMGNVIHVSEFTVPTVHDYATGTSGARTIDPDALTDAGLDIDLSSEKAFAFLVDDIDQAQAAGSMNQVTGEAVGALAEDFDTAIAAALLAGGTDGDPGGGTPTDITDGEGAYAMVLALRRQLSQLKAPLGDRYLAVNPAFSEFLLGADSKLSQADMSGSPAGLRDATIGRLLGFNVVETALLSPSLACAVAYHRSAVGIASQLDKTEALRDPKRFADIMRGLHVYGIKILRSASVLYWQAAA